MDIKEFSDRNKFAYSHCLKAVGNDSLANVLLKEFYEDNVIDLDKNFEDLETIKKIGNRYLIKNIKAINTEYSDIFSVLYNDKIYFSSTRPSGIDNKKYKWNNQPYLDNYFLSKDSIVNNVSIINTEFHDADITINRLNDDIYFSSSQPDENIFLKKDQIITSKIFKATFDNGNLIKLTSLPFNSNEYSCKTPFFDFENKRLYFSSNMPNGKGGFDIYYVNVQDFNKVINVDDVNSINDEDNFYIDSNKNIYFSSNGYVGFGGKDIYTKIYDKESKTYKRIMNVGYPVNSSADDFGYKNIDKKGFLPLIEVMEKAMMIFIHLLKQNL
ncbi:MAG: hypothetical protein HC854_08850 [Flavobacterium sp.]|nr:hypothetical protein [Flavobacterium sp.]